MFGFKKKREPEFSELELARYKEILDKFMDKRRPPVHIRDKMDISYRITGQTVDIFVIREWYRDPRKKIEEPIVRTTYVKDRDVWKIYWMRADLKWHEYPPDPESDSLEKVIKIVDEDPMGCFWG